MSRHQNRLAAALLIALPLAQGQATVPGFDIASVKASEPDLNTSGILKPSLGGLTATNLALREYIAWAYGVRAEFIMGPKWTLSARFDIVARTGDPSGRDRVKLMLRSLLADRFQLSVHTERRLMPVYALLVGKGGPSCPGLN